jgi:SRSO17 transposase
VADADYGANPNVRRGVEARHERYVVAVRTDFPVCGGGAATSPVCRADERLRTVPRWQWRTRRWRRGTNGWRRKKCVAVRGWRVTSDGHRHAGGLVGERATQGPPEERNSVWSNRPPDIPLAALAGYAHRRHAIAQLHEEAKGELGWDQYQGRLWPGFHRHAVTVMLAYSLLVWLERPQRPHHTTQGRRCDPFSPAATVPATLAPGRASRGRPMAPAPSCALVGHNRSVHRTVLAEALTE